MARLSHSALVFTTACLASTTFAADYTPQQQHMIDCNNQAHGLTGDDRKDFMYGCIKGVEHASPAPAAPALTATKKAPLAAKAAGAPEKPTVKYDKFDKTTNVQIVTEKIGSKRLIMMIAAIDSAGSITEMDFMLMNYDKTWQFLNCPSFALLVDDGPMDFGKEPKHLDQVLDGGLVTEHRLFHMSMAQLDRLVAAKSIEYKQCNDETTVSKRALASIQRFKTTLDAEISKAKAHDAAASPPAELAKP